MMGLAWQQAPFGPNPAGRFLTEDPLPEHILYAEPAGRRMRVELAGAVVARSDTVTVLHETGRYPVAYFPIPNVDPSVLSRSATLTHHPVLGDTVWWSLQIAGQEFPDAAWSHPNPPDYADSMTGLIAFVWDAMDAFYEEDEAILGHAADPYHRIDVRASSRRLTVHAAGELIADTRAPLAVFETGFAPRWYVSRHDIAAAVLHDDPLRTLCPYKGVAQYFDIIAGERRLPAAAWSYPNAVPESARLAGYISFDPAQVEMSLDGLVQQPAAHQEIATAGTDRNLAAAPA
jgi:uncharacterized protein (DUF427 family)